MDADALLRAIPDAIVVVDDQVNLIYVNEAGEELLCWRREDWIGRSLLELIHPDDVAFMVSSAVTVLGKRVGTPIEARARYSDGSWRWLEFVGSDALQADGVHGLVVVARDITQRRLWEVAAGDTAIFQHLVQQGSSIILLLDDVGNVTSVNAAFTRLLGHDQSLVRGRALSSFCEASDAPELDAALRQAASTGSAPAVEVAMVPSDPTLHTRAIRFEIVNLLDDPIVRGFVVTGHDISDLHRARRSLEHLARHDALTGLANRSVLIEQLERMLDTRQPVAAVFIDLDRFKPVNDLFGHDAGGELLCEVSNRLRQVIRQGDLVARLGDEFVVLAVGVDELATGEAFCERIDATLAEPYLLADGWVRVTASVGLAMADADSTVTSLLADADVAMYEAKAERRGGLPAAPGRAGRRSHRRGRGIGQVGTPRLGTLGPMAFLGLAEDAGLDLLLGDAILRGACAALAALPGHVRLAINLSVAQLADRGLADRISLILTTHGIAPERLTVEITERDTLARRAGDGRFARARRLRYRLLLAHPHPPLPAHGLEDRRHLRVGSLQPSRRSGRGGRCRRNGRSDAVACGGRRRGDDGAL